MVMANGGVEYHTPALLQNGTTIAAVDICLINPTGQLIEFGGNHFTTEAVYLAAPTKLLDCRPRKASPCIGNENECALVF